MGVLPPVFSKKREASDVLLVPVVFQVPLTQNKSNAKVAYFSVAYSTTLQNTITKSQTLGISNSKHSFVTVLVASKSKIKVPAHVVSGDSSHLSC